VGWVERCLEGLPIGNGVWFGGLGCVFLKEWHGYIFAMTLGGLIHNECVGRRQDGERVGGTCLPPPTNTHTKKYIYRINNSHRTATNR